MPLITLLRPKQLRTRGFAFERDKPVNVPPAIFEQLKGDPRFSVSTNVLAIAGEGSLQPRRRTKPTVRMSDVFGDNGKNPHQTAAGDELSEHDPRTDAIRSGTSRYDAGDPLDPTRRYDFVEEGVVTGMAPTILNEQDDGLAGINPVNQEHARREIVPESMIDPDTGRRTDGERQDGSGEGGRREISQAPERDPPNTLHERVEEIQTATDLVDDENDSNFDARGLPTAAALQNVLGWLPTEEDLKAAEPAPAPTTADREQEAKASGGIRIKRQRQGTRRASMSEGGDTGAARAAENDEAGVEI